MVQKWEYLTKFVWANIENKGARETLNSRWPDYKPDKYTPETMIPILDKLGDDSWELVHMEPAFVGNNADILVIDTAPKWTHAYFCVFKRRKSDYSDSL
jgi:hypothetical protein